MKSYTSDELSHLSDRELKDTFFSVRSEINRAKRKKIEVKDLEVYYCYVAREIEMRDRSPV
jgi:hypothetical protein